MAGRGKIAGVCHANEGRERADLSTGVPSARRRTIGEAPLGMTSLNQVCFWAEDFLALVPSLMPLTRELRVRSPTLQSPPHRRPKGD